MHRSALDQAALTDTGVVQEASAQLSQSRGFCMPSWNILSRMQTVEGYTMLVGPSIFEAAPTLRWCTIDDHFEWPATEIPLICLGAIPPSYHEAVISRFERGTRGIILARPEDLSDTLYQRLTRISEWDPFIADTDIATYSKDWWHTGNKKLYASKAQVWHSVRLHPPGDITMAAPCSLPPVPLRDLSSSTDLLAYLNTTPSGPYQANPGAHTWTDGSKQVLQQVELAGAGVVGFFPARRHLHARVGGEANSFCAELVALALALTMADPTIPLTVYSDCHSALQIIFRWRRGDFPPCMEDEEHNDVLTALLDTI